MHFTIHLIFLVFALIPILVPFSSSSKIYTTLNQDFSVISPGDILLSSPTGLFTAGFYPVGDNAYCFAVCFSDSINGSYTTVWMANRDQPVNGRSTKLSLLHSGNLVLQDAGQQIVWMSGTQSASTLQLHDSGNLVLTTKENATIWQSFDFPTDTLLPQQPLTRNTTLVSSRSRANHSSGFYKFYFDNDNVLRLLYDGVEVRSVFWPDPWKLSWQAGRSTYNTSKIASLDSYGSFSSTDDFGFKTSDLGNGPQRRMTLDPDGLLRVYSLDKEENTWNVTWQLDMQPCNIHGICGANGLCTYSPGWGRSCSCLPGYSVKNRRDWSEGCVPDFRKIPCRNVTDTSSFLKVSHSEFYGFDIGFYQNVTLEGCKRLCLTYCDCKGFQYKFDWPSRFYNCFPKTLLFNGYQSAGFQDGMYIRLPKHMVVKSNEIRSGHECITNDVIQVERLYKKHEHAWWKSLAWCVAALGAVEVVCLLVFLYKTRRGSSKHDHGYFQVATGFKRFTYAELKKASNDFGEEIGRGGSGVVYKGMLSDKRTAAIKRLLINDEQGEAEFLAEVGTIGSLNHGNLIEHWGYCAEGKHRLLVYEYLENGSLADNLCSDKLDWRKRFGIALGTAKGLAYLHEECLEWVLHCDVKPQNILLDSNYEPKVADFGLSKKVKRSNVENFNVSTIRGTRGYMAPEWVLNLPITSKVDVFSYGIVVLEMVTGKSPKELNLGSGNGGIFRSRHWNGEIEERPSQSSSSFEKIVDPKMGGEYDADELEKLVQVALQCVQERRDARPTMTQVVDMLLAQGTGHRTEVV